MHPGDPKVGITYKTGSQLVNPLQITDLVTDVEDMKEILQNPLAIKMTDLDSTIYMVSIVDCETTLDMFDWLPYNTLMSLLDLLAIKDALTRR